MDGTTLGEAWLWGYSPHVRCNRGKRIGPVKVEPCGYTADLDLATLLWAKGARYPVSRLSQRLKCPRCGGRSITLAWLPTGNAVQRRGQQFYQCEEAAFVGRRARLSQPVETGNNK